MALGLIRRRNEAGFSLSELLTTMGVAAALLAIATPQLPRYVAELRIAGSASQIAVDLQRTRMKAVGENAFYRLVFRDAGSYYRQSSQDGTTFVDDGAAAVLPSGVRLVGTVPEVTFNRLGTVGADATVTVTNALGMTKTLRINVLGNITIS